MSRLDHHRHLRYRPPPREGAWLRQWVKPGSVGVPMIPQTALCPWDVGVDVLLLWRPFRRTVDVIVEIEMPLPLR